MSQIVSFLDDLARATPLFLVLASFIGYYYREKLKQVLSRSMLSEIETLKKDLNKELAEHSAQLQRDIETYKVSLIAEAERVKATQDVKKSLALRMAERKFNALFGLLDAHTGFDTSVIVHAETTLAGDAALVESAFMDNQSKLMEQFGQYSAAASTANAFLSIDNRRLVLTVRDSALRLLSSRMTHAEPAAVIFNPVVQMAASKQPVYYARLPAACQG
ncbi:hypothetical protein HXW73_10850 [Halomonas sp. SH5A2]|uniref:hypothetical protein n=1 Tax=Halomonas sp. SH5A2 TaxID=2749040 RepID=UPI0016408EC4|nr:hypothetical protein [Halomonas sp. SH5A2]QNI03389.1 hypothetical protein HXW73_10850 [Halomonas sp. SH5A2]